MKLRVRSGHKKRRREPLAVAIGPEPVQVAIAWYDRKSFSQLRELASDPEALDESYEAWLSSAESTLRQLQEQGLAAFRFPLDVAAAAAWAREQGRPFNGAARAEYVTEAAREQGTGS